jgi:hypothetical protein
MEWWTAFLAQCTVCSFWSTDMDDTTGFFIFRDARHDAYHMFHLDGHYDPSEDEWPALFLDVPYKPELEDGLHADTIAYVWYQEWPLDKTVRIDLVRSICETPWLSKCRLRGWSGVRFAFACSVVRSGVRSVVRSGVRSGVCMS